MNNKWITLFTQVNIDCKADGQEVVLTDVDYYAEQIHNLTNEEDYDKAEQMAKLMASIVAKFNKDMTILQDYWIADECSDNFYNYFLEVYEIATIEQKHEMLLKVIVIWNGPDTCEMVMDCLI